MLTPETTERYTIIQAELTHFSLKGPNYNNGITGSIGTIFPMIDAEYRKCTQLPDGDANTGKLILM